MLPAGGRRRTQGLRREAVAQLAAISSIYYTYPEQGRRVRPSRQVLDALAAALRFDATERSHVPELVHGALPADRPAVRGATSPSVVALVDRLIDRLDPCSTYATGRHWDVLASNRPPERCGRTGRRARPRPATCSGGCSPIPAPSRSCPTGRTRHPHRERQVADSVRRFSQRPKISWSPSSKRASRLGHQSPGADSLSSFPLSVHMAT
nr:helix-turn-helix domain-containing protein [Actinomadura bangladeshensis]